MSCHCSGVRRGSSVLGIVLGFYSLKTEHTQTALAGVIISRIGNSGNHSVCIIPGGFPEISIHFANKDTHTDGNIYVAVRVRSIT